MRHSLTALLSAGAIGAFACASPALAQTVGVAPAPRTPPRRFRLRPAGNARASTGTPSAPLIRRTGTVMALGPLAMPHRYHNVASSPASGGECDIIAGNGVCFP